VPQPDDLRRYYKEQLALAEKEWGAMRKAHPEHPEPPPATEGPS
jgi:hypothetical protein